jgi:hypothetical protein
LEENFEELDDCAPELRVTRDLDPDDARPQRELMKAIEDTFNAYGKYLDCQPFIGLS